MENFKHLPEPFRIRVIEPVKRTVSIHQDGVDGISSAGMG